MSRWFVVRLCILLFILTSINSVAQKYTLGVKGGASITWPRFGEKADDQIFNGRIKPGFNAAVIVGFPLSDHYSLSMEGGVSQKGRILTFNENPKWINDMNMQMVDVSMWLRKSYKFMLKANTPSEVFFCYRP